MLDENNRYGGYGRSLSFLICSVSSTCKANSCSNLRNKLRRSVCLELVQISIQATVPVFIASACCCRCVVLLTRKALRFRLLIAAASTVDLGAFSTSLLSNFFNHSLVVPFDQNSVSRIMDIAAAVTHSLSLVAESV